MQNPHPGTDIRQKARIAVRRRAPASANPQHPRYSSPKLQGCCQILGPGPWASGEACIFILFAMKHLRIREVESPSSISEMLLLGVCRDGLFSPIRLGPQYFFQRELPPAYRAVYIRKYQFFAAQPFSDPPQHFLGGCRDKSWMAANAVEILDAFFLLHYPEDMIRPGRLPW
jgi:hypothetical protein